MAEELEQHMKDFNLSESENLIIDIESEDVHKSEEECKRSLFGKIIGDRKAHWVGLKRAVVQIVEATTGTGEWREGLSGNHTCFEDMRLKFIIWRLPKQVNINLKEPLVRCTSIRLEEHIVVVNFKYEKLVNLCYYCGKIRHLERGCVNEGKFGEWLKAVDGLQWTENSSNNNHSGSLGSQPIPVTPHLNASVEKNNGGEEVVNKLCLTNIAASGRLEEPECEMVPMVLKAMEIEQKCQKGETYSGPTLEKPSSEAQH
ncbi:gag-pol polyprotein [Striga asiatica]|uniref:Gag-pol polyprotein n=1 Tax=Striga asiatica TaxID=4170 RepID=A0A5A7R577_STRAF|nr:gag-pol polyprotein [Striga asiatica]